MPHHERLEAQDDPFDIDVGDDEDDEREDDEDDEDETRRRAGGRSTRSRAAGLTLHG